jgi:hypothetical protein
VSFLLLFLAVALHAQTELGTIRGVATDTSGAVLPGAAITLTNQETNVPRAATSTPDGAYEFPFLPIGSYRLEVKARGFETFVAKDILIRAREVRRLDAEMKPGTQEVEVTVEAGAATIATEGGQISAGFSNKQFVDSPMSQQTFFPQTLMTTLPFVQTQNGNVNLRFAGQGPTQIAQNMDGVPNDGANNLTQNMFDFEDLQVVPVLNSAEFSRVGEFSMASRRGSNQWHGRIFYDIANSFLDARSFFNTGRKQPYKEHRGAASVSGPIIRNKLFFYGAYNLDRIPSSTLYTRVVPIPAFRTGDFSSVAPLKNPFAPGTFFSGNQIGSYINSVSRKVQDTYIPLPNATVTGGNYQFVHPYPTDLMKWDGFTGRVDYNMGQKNLLFARYINRLTPYILAGAFPGLGTWTRNRNSSQLVVNDTVTLSSRLVSSVEFGWSRDVIKDGDSINGFTPTHINTALSTIGLQGVNLPNYDVMGFPSMTISGAGGITALTQPVGGLGQNRNDFFVSNITTLSKGKHVIRFGAQLRTFHDHPNAIPQDTFGTFTFSGGFTGNAYADFLLGLPTTLSRAQSPLTNRISSAYELGLFATDTLKISQNLTLDFGLRWETFAPAKYADGLMYNYDPATGNIIVTTQGLAHKSFNYNPAINVVAGDPYSKAARFNFRPRIGASYRINEKTVIRGGFGSYSEAFGNLARLNTGGPFSYTESYTANTTAAPVYQFPNPFPGTTSASAVPNQSAIANPARFSHGSILQYSLSAERELPWRFGVRVSYAGSRSIGMNYLLETNKPVPSTTLFTQSRRPRNQFVSTQVYMSDGQARYDAGNITLTHRTQHTIIEAHYTMSNSAYDYGNLQNPYDHYQWNRDSFNAHDRFVLSTSYDLPFGHGRQFLDNDNRVVDAVVGGWQTTFVQYLQTGQWFSPTFSGYDPSGTGTIGGLPDQVGNPNLARNKRSSRRYFNPDAFTCPGQTTRVCSAGAPIGRFGTSHINNIEGPGLHVSHLSALKSFHIHDRVTSTLQINISNLLNSPHWDFPNANISTITGASAAGTVFQLKDAASNGLGGRELSGPRQVSGRIRIEF